jgi:hypothetical protein
MSESRPLPSLRYRRCPQCQEARPASEFWRVTGPTFAARATRRRRCPRCDFIGPLADFPIVEPPAAPDEGTPS